MRHGWSITIGRIGGTVVRVHLTFLLLLLWVGAAGWQSAGAASAWLDVAFVVALFGCVLLHEFGHVLVARAFGFATRDITLYPIGGLANIQRGFETPRQELAIAGAGPVVSLVIAAVPLLIAGSRPELTTLGPAADWRSFAALLGAANLVLALFNLLPAFPMDGGRILRALMSWWLGRRTGTRIAVWTGRIGGAVFIFYGLTHGEILLAVVGVFILFAASAEAAAVDLHDALAGATAGAVMASDVALLPDTATIADGIATALRTEQRLFPIVDRLGRPAGMISRDDIVVASRTRGADESLAALSRTAPIVGGDEPVTRVAALLEGGEPAVLVTKSGGVLAGVIGRDTLAERRLLGRQHGARVARRRLQPR